MDHEAVIKEAWDTAGSTTAELTSVRVNDVLRERYEVTPPFSYTRTDLWDMEKRKAAAPDIYIPTVVKPGSAEKFPSVHNGQIEDFTRVSQQRRWGDPDNYDLIIEHVRLDHESQRAFFVGAEHFVAPDGREFTAGTGQPIFHVEHSVGGTEEDPLNMWRIVFLTDEPQPKLAEAFNMYENDPYLRVFIEVHLEKQLGRKLVRR